MVPHSPDFWPGRYLCLAAVAFVLAHICFQACRVYNLVAVSYVPSDPQLEVVESSQSFVAEAFWFRTSFVKQDLGRSAMRHTYVAF